MDIRAKEDAHNKRKFDEWNKKHPWLALYGAIFCCYPGFGCNPWMNAGFSVQKKDGPWDDDGNF